MKKIFCIILTAAIFLTVLSGCGNETISDKSSQKLSIVTTIFPQYDFARQIAGDKADVKMLLAPAQESHGFEPTPKDIISVHDCDLFIYTGGESEKWAQDILDSSGKQIRTVSLMDCVLLFEEEEISGMDEHSLHADEKSDETEYDEHVWTSPKNAEAIVQKITEALCEIDPQNADYFKKNSDDYTNKLDDLDEKFKQTVKNGKRKTVVFGDRFPLLYFVKQYGLDYYAAFPGCSEQTEASSATIAFLIDKVKDEKIPVVFKIELSNDNIAKAVAEPTNAKVMTFYSCHNISREDFDNGETYLSLMTKNIDALKSALG